MPTITFPQVHNANAGQDYWFAPSQAVIFPCACSCWLNGSCSGILNAAWGADGSLVLSGSAPVGQIHVPSPSTLSPIPDGVEIYRYNGTEQVQTLPPNPLANPTFQTGW